MERDELRHGIGAAIVFALIVIGLYYILPRAVSALDELLRKLYATETRRTVYGL